MEEGLSSTYQSNCKINLGLQVLNKREDGLHNLESIFVELDFHDTITFNKSNSFQFLSNNKTIENNLENTIINAYHLMQPLCKKKDHYSIHLLKNIPIGSGLGGGSSNAATVLKVLNRLWDINLTDDELLKIGAKIGSDVPFFISGGIQYIKGIGDILHSMPNIKMSQFFILLIYPNVHINTKWAYQALKKGLEVPETYNKFLDSNNQVNWQLLKNDFENVVFSTYPEISRIKKQLISRKVLYAGLSGSGSTVYGIFTNKKEAMNASLLFPSYRTYVTSPTV